MIRRIIIGNAISLFSSVFLFASCMQKTRTRIYAFQIFECLSLLVAQLVFGQWAAAFALLLSAARNALLAIGKYTKAFLATIFILTLALGVLFNTGGLVGMIPTMATLIYTLTSYYAESIVKIKLSVLINLALWLVYSSLIFDIASLAINLISFILNLITLIKAARLQKGIIPSIKNQSEDTV